MTKDRCKYELHVEKYFGLPALFPQEQKISVEYATLCDLLVSFEQQIRDDEREKTLGQFGITTGPENH